MKQTSIEWLVNQVKEDQTSRAKTASEWNLIFQQAHQMHKEEIEDAYWEGGQDVPSHGKQCEQYYKETYGK